MEQEIIGDDRSALEAVVAADEELTALRAEQARLEASNNADDNERLVEVYEKLNLRDSDAARARASKILAGLGFDQAMQARSTKVLQRWLEDAHITCPCALHAANAAATG